MMDDVHYVTWCAALGDWECIVFGGKHIKLDGESIV